MKKRKQHKRPRKAKKKPKYTLDEILTYYGRYAK